MPQPDLLFTQVRAEIRKLRPGRGVYEPDLFLRLGPHLLRLCGTTADSAQVRPTLIQQLLACASALPGEHQDVLAISLAIDSEVSALTRFTDRVARVATLLRVSTRTAIRRINDAETELATEIATVLSAGPGVERFVRSYYVREYRAVVDHTRAHADPATVVVHQEREIVCVQPGLAEVPIRFGLPDHPDTPESMFSVQVHHGGRIRSQRRISPTGFELLVTLPAPLAQRQSHRFSLVFTFPADLVRAHHVITGEVTIRRYLLIVRFHPDHLPTWIRRVDAEDIRTLDAFADRARAPYGEFALDAVGEMRLEFDRLSPHLAYGCQYSWADPPGGGGRER
ncbi:hypothetical protein [Actinokineospora terrae]|uniref:Uncharacterized protein n=1 Tax=Actinokineospora terrae TaxID=155974 RepID=A0A1H9WZJ6_9PSEU|nr:hypothetical protein [Actinokineospora terrae]SES39275.1 hypothetical protein SAMN04487818_11250 [Actinokineospora terrae]